MFEAAGQLWPCNVQQRVMCSLPFDCLLCFSSVSRWPRRWALPLLHCVVPCEDMEALQLRVGRLSAAGFRHFGVRLSTAFNQSLVELPPSVTEVIFCKDFNTYQGLPPSVTHLEFGYFFNQSVANLPTGLTHLTFRYKFNQPVDSQLPHTVSRSARTTIDLPLT